MTPIQPVRRCFSRHTVSFNKHGFALVVSLGILAFLVLLLLSLSTLVRVSATNLRVSQGTESARHNALLGLNLALAELQHHAGPDQRITARADILNTTHTDNALWTGIWRSDGDANSKEHLTWLVSSPDQLPDPTTSAQNLPDSVLLYGDGSMGNQTSSPSVTPAAYAPLVTVSSDSGTGSYAYWIGDEGIKANITPVKAIESQDNNENRFEAFTSARSTQALAHEALKEFNLTDNYPGFVNSLERVGVPSGLANATSSEGISSSVTLSTSPDLSVASIGLMINARDGGLKKDLTAAFESNEVFTSVFQGSPSETDELPLYFLDDAITETLAGSPGMRNLFSYYQQSKDNEIESGLVRVENYVPQKEGLNVNPAWKSFYTDTTKSYQDNSPVTPIISFMQFHVSFEFYHGTTGQTLDAYLSSIGPGEDVDNSGPWKLRVHMHPSLAIYNPYNVSMEIPGLYFEWTASPLIRVSIGNQSRVDFYFYELLPTTRTQGENAVTTDYTRLRLSYPDTFDLRPGETRYFSIAGGQTQLSDGQAGFQAILENDWSESSSIYLNIDDAKTASNSGPAYNSSSNNASLGLTNSEKADLTVQSINDQVRTEFRVEKMGEFWLKIGGANDANAVQSMGTRPGNINRPAEYRAEASYTHGTLSGAQDNANLTWRAWLRSSSEDNLALRNLIDTNPRWMSGSEKYDGYTYDMYSPFTGGNSYGVVENSDFSLSISDLDRLSGYLGNSVSSTGQPRAILFDVPRTPPLSLGQFQHANLGYTSVDPAYIIGNSYAPSRINSTEATRIVGSGSDTESIYDWSYLANEKLWDDYFMSGIHTEISQSEFENAIASNSAITLPNARIVPYQSPFDSKQITDVTTYQASDSEDSDKVFNNAGRLLMHGAFNVNSTSIQAWKVFLASYQYSLVPELNPSDGSISSWNQENEALFSRFALPLGSYSSDSTDNTFWTGYRTLNDDELTSLATAIVTEIKSRGPAYSMANFVNREIDVNVPDYQRLKGRLQAGIDQSGVNASLPLALGATNAPNSIPQASTEYYAFPDHDDDPDFDTYPQNMAQPGYLMQGDILSGLGSFMTVRSDTFLIRSYGETMNPITNEKAQAWCEALVQRYPDPVGADNTNYLSELQQPSSPFGREFRIVAFRWLNENEI